MESILTSIKKMLGIDEAYIQFDIDIIIHINSVFSILNQIGVGPVECFSISDNSSLWKDFTDDNAKLNLVKSYTMQKVKLLFDPALSSVVVDVMNRQIAELEWRLNTISDSLEGGTQ